MTNLRHAQEQMRAKWKPAKKKPAPKPVEPLQLVTAPKPQPVVEVAPQVKSAPPEPLPCIGLCKSAGGGRVWASPQCPKHFNYGVPDRLDGRDKPGKTTLAEAREWSEI